MFGFGAHEVDAQAEVLDEGTLVGKPRLMNGYAYGEFDYQVEVKLPDQAAFRTVARGLACTGCKPEPGDILAVKCNPKKHTAHFDIERDERFDPVVVAKQHVDSATEEDALYAALEDKGARGVATVRAIRKGRHRFDNVEVFSDVHVVGALGEELDATIVDWVFEKVPEHLPEVGQKRRVLFDPSDPRRIRWRE